jgi:hypothetical protein
MNRLRVSLALLAGLLLAPLAVAQTTGSGGYQTRATGVSSIDNALGRVYGTGATATPAATTYKPAYDTSYYSRYTDPTFRPAVGEHYVNGYYRGNGTYVSGYYQTNADNSFWNNYSSLGNVNPHTGRVGTKTPTTRSTRTYRGP